MVEPMIFPRAGPAAVRNQLESHGQDLSRLPWLGLSELHGIRSSWVPRILRTNKTWTSLVSSSSCAAFVATTVTKGQPGGWPAMMIAQHRRTARPKPRKRQSGRGGWALDRHLGPPSCHCVTRNRFSCSSFCLFVKLMWNIVTVTVDANQGSQYYAACQWVIFKSCARVDRDTLLQEKEEGMHSRKCSACWFPIRSHFYLQISFLSNAKHYLGCPQVELKFEHQKMFFHFVSLYFLWWVLVVFFL
jgi:hypothetical protein